MLPYDSNNTLCIVALHIISVHRIPMHMATTACQLPEWAVPTGAGQRDSPVARLYSYTCPSGVVA